MMSPREVFVIVLLAILASNFIGGFILHLFNQAHLQRVKQAAEDALEEERRLIARGCCVLCKGLR